MRCGLSFKKQKRCAALSSQFDTELSPTEVLINPPEGGLAYPSVVLLNQIRSIDRQRLVKKLSFISEEILGSKQSNSNQPRFD